MNHVYCLPLFMNELKSDTFCSTMLLSFILISTKKGDKKKREMKVHKMSDLINPFFTILCDIVFF